MQQRSHVVHLFAAACDLVGSPTLTVEPSSTVAELRRQLVERYPSLAPLLPKCRIAVNHEFAEDDAVIPPGAELAVIPPVSGG